MRDEYIAALNVELANAIKDGKSADRIAGIRAEIARVSPADPVPATVSATEVAAVEPAAVEVATKPARATKGRRIG